MTLIFLFLIMGFPSIVLAEEMPSVVINEIAWMGTSVKGVDSKQEWRYEWLELYNYAKDGPLHLEGWSVELYRGDELYFKFSLSGSIAPEEYFLIGASDKILGVDVNYSNLGGKFVNSGTRVVLKDNANNIVDEVDAREGWPAGENETKRTMERAAEAWQTSAMFGGTPKAKNSEGFKELVANLSSFTSKKDPGGSFKKESLHIFSSSFPLALVLALGSGAGVLCLRRYLARQS